MNDTEKIYKIAVAVCGNQTFKRRVQMVKIILGIEQDKRKNLGQTRKGNRPKQGKRKTTN